MTIKEQMDQAVLEGKIKVNGNSYFKKCPSCGEFISTSSKYNALIRLGTLCRRCVATSRTEIRDISQIQEKDGRFCRQCPTCSRLVRHTKRERAIETFFQKCSICRKNTDQKKNSPAVGTVPPMYLDVVVPLDILGIPKV